MSVGPIVLGEERIVARVLAHAAARTSDRYPRVHEERCEIYADPERLARERALVFDRVPAVVAPTAVLRGAGAYLSREHLGTPLLLVRDDDERLCAFVNACRHRGAPVAEGSGCAKAFVCPYHGWTYDRAGALLHVPHEQAFGGAAKGRHLRALPIREHGGLMWRGGDAAAHLAPVASELALFRLAERTLLHASEREVAANWKIFVEGFLEGYHIRVTHRDSFYPYGFDNLSVNDYFGPHSRIVFPFKRVLSLGDLPPDERRLRRHATIVIHLFPNVIIIAQPYHVQVVVIEPLGPTSSRLYQYALAEPEGDDEKARRDLEFLAAGLEEDMRIGAAVQSKVAALRGDTVLFGEQEGALIHFHAELGRYLG